MDPLMRRAHDAFRALLAEPATTLGEQRSRYERWAARFPLPDDTVVEPLGFAPGLWVTTPVSRADRVVLHLHSGAYRFGSAAVAREIGARLAEAAGARVALLDYPLAPEHPFPAAPDAAHAAYRALLEEYAASRVAVSGDSAGGGLALGVLVRLRDEGLPLPAAAAVNSPWTDLECTGASMLRRAARDPWIDRKRLLLAAREYLAGTDPRHPYASPLHADLSGLPPLLVQVGTEEVLHDDSVALDRRARASGVDSRLLVTKDAPHVWHHFCSFLPEARGAVRAFGDHVRAHIPDA